MAEQERQEPERPGLGPLQGGRYQLLELIARGGMAEVYRAKSRGAAGFEKDLVIKRILPELSSRRRFVEMFVNEAKIAVTLTHPNIVQVFDLGMDEGAYFIAMELVQGADLATVLRRGRRRDARPTFALSAKIALEVAKALDYAHRRRQPDGSVGVIHRDISPQNILLGTDGEVKLTDFGIAKVMRMGEEQEGELLQGKYAYMSPEQARGDAIDRRSDIFALGIVLYECLAGSNPLLAASSAETLERVRQAQFPRVGELIPAVPDMLQQIVARATASDPADRYPDAGELQDELAHFLHGLSQRPGRATITDFLSRATHARVRKDSGATMRLRQAFELTTQTGRRLESASSAQTPSSSSAALPLKEVEEQPELRDVTLLVSEGPLKPSHATSMLSLGTRLDASAVVFGVRSPDGRDAQLAARVALEERAGRRLVIHHGRVLVKGRTLVPSERLDALVDQARRLLIHSTIGTPTVTEQADPLLTSRFRLKPTTHGTLHLVGERASSHARDRFVGRQRELKEIGRGLARASRGERQFIAIEGRAGTGKTRILDEVERRLGAHGAQVYRCAIPPGREKIGFGALRTLLRTILGCSPGSEERDHAQQRLRRHGLLPSELDAVSRAVGMLEDSEGPRTRPLVAGLARLVANLASEHLTVFMLDDFEHVDAESFELLRRLLGSKTPARVAVIAAHRPSEAVEFGEAPLIRVPVRGFRDEELLAFVADRLRTDQIPSRLLHHLKDQGHGNPLHLEEALRALLSAGAITRSGDGTLTYDEATAVEVPASLRGLVASRLVALSGLARRILRVLALSSLPTPPNVIQAVTVEATDVEAGIQQLATAGLIRQEGPGWKIAHAIVRDVVHQTIPSAQRKHLHLRLARALEEHPGSPDGAAHRLAYHYRHAGDPARAVDFLLRAADSAAGLHAPEEAVARYDEALELLDDDRERALTVYRCMLELCDERQRATLGLSHVHEALDFAERIGRADAAARFTFLHGRFLLAQRAFAEALDHFERARRLADEVGSPELLRDTLNGASEALARNGEFVRAAESLPELLELERRNGERAGLFRVLLHGALVHAGSGEDDVAQSLLTEARGLHESDPARISQLAKTESVVAFQSRNLARATEAAERGLRAAREASLPLEEAVNAHNLGEMLLRRGETRRAFKYLRRSHALCLREGYEQLLHTNLGLLGYLDAVVLGNAEGRSRVVAARDYAERNDQVWDVVQADFLLGLVDAHQGEFEEAIERLAEALARAAQHGMRRYTEDLETALAALSRGERVTLSSSKSIAVGA